MRQTSAHERTMAKLTALVAVVTSIGLNVPAAILMRTFEFPGILRRPALEVITLFARHAGTVIPTYYAFALASLCLIPLAVLTRALLDDRTSALLDLATTLGILTGLTQAIGFLRWPFMEPALVSLYFAPGASIATRDAVLVVHEAFNRFAGVAIGEHLGWLLTGTWLLALGAYAIRRPTWVLPRPAGVALVICGASTLVSTAEQFGVQSRWVGMAFYAGYVTWTILLLAWAAALFIGIQRRQA